MCYVKDCKFFESKILRQENYINVHKACTLYEYVKGHLHKLLPWLFNHCLICCLNFIGADIELGASSPLMEAATEGHVDLVRFLLERGISSASYVFSFPIAPKLDAIF